MSNWTTVSQITLACARGLTPLAIDEVRALGYSIAQSDNDSITIRGTMLDAMRLNLWLRTAHRVLLSLGQFEAKNVDHLYAHAKSIPWESWLTSDGYFTVRGAVKNDTVRDTRLPVLKIKDAIADRMRDVCGRRPDSGNDNSGASIFFLWRQRDLRIFIDTSGIPLSRRGYRLIPGKAPMQEALAAACIAASGWQSPRPFVAPMCGSGTLAIEAALMAKRRAPGLTRQTFAFQSLAAFDDPAEEGDRATPREIWQELIDSAIRDELPSAQMPRICATDISGEAIRIARANAKAADVEKFITFSVCDFADTTLPDGHGTIFLNPEYGERMGDMADLIPLHRRIGKWIANNSGYDACVFTASRRLAEAIGIEPDKLIAFFNGALDCRLLLFPSKNTRPEHTS